MKYVTTYSPMKRGLKDIRKRVYRQTPYRVTTYSPMKRGLKVTPIQPSANFFRRSYNLFPDEKGTESLKLPPCP